MGLCRPQRIEDYWDCRPEFLQTIAFTAGWALLEGLQLHNGDKEIGAPMLVPEVAFGDLATNQGVLTWILRKKLPDPGARMVVVTVSVLSECWEILVDVGDASCQVFRSEEVWILYVKSVWARV